MASRISPRVAVETVSRASNAFSMMLSSCDRSAFAMKFPYYNVLLSLWPLSWLEIARTLCQGLERVNRACATGRRS